MLSNMTTNNLYRKRERSESVTVSTAMHPGDDYESDEDILFSD